VIYDKLRRESLRVPHVCRKCNTELIGRRQYCGKCLPKYLDPRQSTHDNLVRDYKLKAEVIQVYGGKCNLCGTDHIEFLCIDHVNNDGSIKRANKEHGTGRSLYKWLKEHGFPKTFQLLCFNCNHLKHLLHNTSKKREYPRIGKTQVCSKCGEEKDLGQFYYRKDRNRHNTMCIQCHRQNDYDQKLKIEVMAHYSNEIVCSCCGETNIDLLSIDHIEGLGNQHRRETGDGKGLHFYRWLHTNNYPLGFQVLCLNCNFSEGYFGYCPHEHQQGQRSNFNGI
jgi:hypothetical protein